MGNGEGQRAHEWSYCNSVLLGFVKLQQELEPEMSHVM